MFPRAAAAAICAVLLAACADPVTDAITAAERFAIAKDFDEAERILARTPFKTPEEKGRLAAAQERIEHAKKVAYIDKVLVSVEAERDMPQGGPFFGLASLERFFTPPLLHRYNKQVMRYNQPIEACEVRKRENALLLCPRRMPYAAVHMLLDSMVDRAEQFAAEGDVLRASCTRVFVLDTLQPVLNARTDRMIVTNRLFSAVEMLRAKAKLGEDEFRARMLEAQGVCSPEVVFGKGV